MVSTLAEWYYLVGVAVTLWLAPMNEERFIIYLLWVIFWPIGVVLVLNTYISRER